ncbi:T9SS type B sorting domain-containing protein [Rhodoflexus sp.]
MSLRNYFCSLSLWTAAYLCLLVVVAHAQSPVQPCFRLPAEVVCAPATITPTDCSGAPPNLVVYDYGDGQLRLDKSFTFTRPGRYLIRQGINTLGAGGNLSQPIELTVIAPRNPTFRVQTCNDLRVSVEITDTGFPAYEIAWGDGTTARAQSGGNIAHTYSAAGEFTITVSGITGQNTVCGSTSQRINAVAQIPAPALRAVNIGTDGRARLSYTLPTGFNYRLRQVNTSNNTTRLFDLAAGSSSFTSPDVTSVFDRYVYSIEALNPCTPNVPVTYFNQLGTHTLRVLPFREFIRINWNAPLHIGFTSYTLFRNGTRIGEWTSQNILQFEDRDITCRQQYCYRLEVRYYNGAAVSTAQEVCITTSRDSDPQPLTETLATVINEQVQITWRQPERTQIARVLLRKTAPGQSVQQMTLPNTRPPFIDSNVFTSGDAYCYQLAYIDNCGNQSPWTAPFCTTVLSGSVSGDSVLLNWQELVGYRVAGYVVEQLDSQGRTINVLRPSQRTSMFIPVGDLTEQVLRLRLMALVNIGSGGTVALYSNLIRLRVEATLTFPTAFSPNGDGLNDTFGVQARFVNRFVLQIFNRWGELVYFSENPNDRWDGNFKGTTVPTGTYALVIQAEDNSGRKIERKAMLLIAK